MSQGVGEEVEQHALDLVRGAARPRRGRRRRSSRRTAAAPRLAATPRTQDVDESVEAHVVSSIVSAPASMRASSKRSSTSGLRRRTWSPSAARYSSGSRARPRPPRASPGCAASGVRRSWLAQATSSRRASKSCSSFAAISLKARAELGELGRALLGRPCGQVAARRARPTRRAPDRPDSRSSARRRVPPTIADRRGGGRDGEDVDVVAHVEHHPRPIGARPRAAARPRAEAGRRARAHARQQPQGESTCKSGGEVSRPRRRARARSRREAIADAPDRLAGNAGARARLRSSRAGGARAP